MSVTIDQFDEFFREAVRNEKGETFDPFPWQTRLANQVFNEGWPECIDLPTASGKTSAIDIAVFVLACQAELPTNERKVGRRIFFTVNRRVIVDEAFDRSFNLAKKLLEAKDGILKDVADALRGISGDKESPPLDVTQLRGGIYRDRAWARSITQPIVVCTTADQLGSRLLFRGYGVSASMQPIHAALTACDSLILLDEAHVTKAFSQTLGLLNRYRQLDKTSPPMRFVQMTATPAGDIPEAKRFSLKDEDWNDPRNAILKQRQEAHKVAELVNTGKKSFIDEIVKRAIAALGESRQAIGIIVNRVQTARDIHAKLSENFADDAYLVIGRMRPMDRDDLQEKLRTIVGPYRPDTLPKPCFVVATQCLEVGADYDFDALITECASIDALRQRFGRLNRKGRPIDISAAIVTNDISLKDEDPIYGNALNITWKWMCANDRKSVDFGIIEFKKLWDSVDKSEQLKMLAPAPDAAVLLPAHLDTLCQTAPYPEPSPDVSFFIHGPNRENFDVNVCWRADLGPNDETSNSLWPEILRLLPPTSPECMTVPITTVRRWLGASYKSDAEADVPKVTPEASEEFRSRSDQRKPTHARKLVAWRGWGNVEVVSSPGEIRPNDTLVIRTQDCGWEAMGHIPGAPFPKEFERRPNEKAADFDSRKADLDHRRERVDAGELATRTAKRKLVVRRHPAIVRNINITGVLDATDLRNRFQELQEFTEKSFIDRKFDWSSRFKRRPYPGVDEESSIEAIVFDVLLEPKDRLEVPVTEDDEGIGESTDAAEPVTLGEHTRHVVERLAGVLSCAKFDIHAPTLMRSSDLHDIGKADLRFNAMLHGCTPSEVLERGVLGKSSRPDLTRREFQEICNRAMYPAGFRHEMLSVELIENVALQLDALVDRRLLLHLIASHHGEARPFAPVVIDGPTEGESRSNNLANFHDRRSIFLDPSEYWPAIGATGEQRKNWTPSHRLDSGIAERFWKLTRDHGWWGLAWLESILRLADQQASASEQEDSQNVQ